MHACPHTPKCVCNVLHDIHARKCFSNLPAVNLPSCVLHAGSCSWVRTCQSRKTNGLSCLNRNCQSRRAMHVTHVTLNTCMHAPVRTYTAWLHHDDATRLCSLPCQSWLAASLVYSKRNAGTRLTFFWGVEELAGGVESLF